MSTPSITIFVRHGLVNGKPCKDSANEFSRRCPCRKHFRWTQDGVQYRRQAGTRSWQEAETAKRQLEDQLSGRAIPAKAETHARTLSDCIRVFLQDREVQGVTPGVLGQYRLDLSRLQTYCEREGVFMAEYITREILTGYCATWGSDPKTSNTRYARRTRLKTFFLFCVDAAFIPRVPSLPRITVDVPPTQPLTPEEYERLLAAVPLVLRRPREAARGRALLQLMRYSGLAIRDAVTLERAEIKQDESGLYRVVTARQKTGTHVSVPLPPAVAEEVLAVESPNPKYVFWSGKGDPGFFASMWTADKVTPVFTAAKIEDKCTMKSHRLRDTFAVELLKKGVPLEEVSKALGHSSIRTTERHYAAWIQGRQDRLDQLVTGTWGK